MSYSGSSHDLKRAIHGAQIQEEMQAAFNRKINEMKTETDQLLQKQNIDAMFTSENTTYEQKFKESIIGLVTRDQFLQKKQEHLGNKEENIRKEKKAKGKKKSKRIREKNEKKKRMLTFADDEEFVHEPPKKKKKISKNPIIDTSFLPDADRDKEDNLLKDEIRKEYYKKQEELKSMDLEITFSYWDGSNHRRTLRIQRGMQVGDFLENARMLLEGNFSELRGILGTNLMFVKDDLIIPQGYTFQELISAKSVGMSRKPLFPIEVWDDQDVGKQCAKETGINGKIVTRSWFERNKHVYPANKWLTYDPADRKSVV